MSSPAKKSRMPGCMFTVPLGCTAFLGGALFVAVVLAPIAGGRVITDVLEEEFHRTFAGWLDLDNARLPSFHGEQSGELLLADPAEDVVLDGLFHAPRIPVFEDVSAWGPVDLRLHVLAIHIGKDGVSNLEKTFTLRDGQDLRRRSDRFQLESDSFENVEEISLRFLIERLVWTDARVEGWSFELRDVNGVGSLKTVSEHELTLTGLSPLTESQPQVAFQLVVPYVREIADLDGSRGFELEFAAESFDAATADLLLRTGGQLEERFGGVLPQFLVRLSKSQDEGTGVFVGVAGKALRVRGPRTEPSLIDLDS